MFNTQKAAADAMAEGSLKVDALAALEAVKSEMQSFQVQADTYKKANDSFKAIAEDKAAAAL